jgi:hypothetical protein
VIEPYLAHLAPALRPTPVVYGDPIFRTMTDIAHRIAQTGRVRGLLGAMLRRPLAVIPVVLAICRLPVIHLTIHPGQTANWYAPDYNPICGTIFGGRRAQAVLDLGPDDAAYLVGRRKQALRTNLNHARQLGIQAKGITTYEEWSAAAHEVLRSRPGGLRHFQRIQPPSDTQEVGFYAVTDQEGCPVAYSVVAIFNGCAVLTSMMSAPQHPAASPSRYLLHTHMRSDLRSRGVRHLIVGNAMTVPPGLQYFQYLLGYEVRNVRVTLPAGRRGLNGRPATALA